MIRQRSLCAILHPIQQKHPLLRHPSAKNIKIRSNNSSRETSPLAATHKQPAIPRQTSVNSLGNTLKEKKERPDSKGPTREHSKTGMVLRDERKASKGSSPINIKKDLKYLISKNTGTLPKKKDPLPTSKPAKPKISNPFNQKPIRHKEEQEALFSKRSSFCELKVIKEEKYPKNKSKKKLSSKNSKISSKESSLDPIHKERSTNQKSSLEESSSNRPQQVDPKLKQVSRALCSEFQVKRPPSDKPNFLQFFKQYRNSFDLRGIRHEQERSKLKSGRFATEAQHVDRHNYDKSREA